MRIKKNKIVKSSEQIDELDPVLAPQSDVELDDSEAASLDEGDEDYCDYEECVEYIYKAIDCLARCANKDPLAKESIANLSVVLLDLHK